MMEMRRVPQRAWKAENAADIRLRVFLDQQAKFFQAILQRPERYAESLGRLAPVAPELTQRRADGFLFPKLEDAFASRLCRQAGQQFSRQFGRCYLSPGQDDGPFNDVLQLTDVTGPAVLLQQGQGSGTDADGAAQAGRG